MGRQNKLYDQAILLLLISIYRQEPLLLRMATASYHQDGEIGLERVLDEFRGCCCHRRSIK